MNLSWLNPDPIIDIIETASQLILQIYIGEDFYVVKKDDESPLTIADRKSNDYICRNLQHLYPWIPIISEENVNEEYEKRKNYSFAWLVDPLDGTKEFIKKNGEFTVNIGLIYNGVPVAGFVTIPDKGLTYWAIQGKGAWVHEVGKEWQSISEIRQSYRPKNGKLRVIASRSHMNDETTEFINRLGDVELLNVGSSIKLLWIAENKADIFPRLGPCWEWDTCATHAIVRELGGKVESYPGGLELIYNKENLLNPFFVCQFNCLPI